MRRGYTVAPTCRGRYCPTHPPQEVVVKSAPSSLRTRVRLSIGRIGSLLSQAVRARPRRPWILPTVLGIVGAAALALVVIARRNAAPQTPALPYSEVVSLLSARQISEIAVEDGGSRLTAKLRAPIAVD